MSFAASQFNNTNGFVPGWKNQVPGTSIMTSWPVMILPFMERNDIYRFISSGTLPSSVTAYIPGFVCPSSPPDVMTTPWMSYAGNCGSQTATAPLVQRKSDGVMLDTTITISGSTNGRISLDDITTQDGTGNTLLVAEQCGPLIALGQWNVVIPSTTGTSFNFAAPSSTQPRAFGIQFGVGPPASSGKVINSGTVGSTAVAGAIHMPSSAHPGGAVVAFCDGSTAFLKDGLPSRVYAQLLTSNNASASTFITGTASAQWGTGNYILNPGDYQ